MSSEEPLVEGVYSRAQISQFLEKTEPTPLLGLQQICLTTNARNPYIGRKIVMIGSRLPDAWDPHMEALKDENDPEKFCKAVTEECKMVQDYYVLHKARFLDVGTVAGQKRLANETGARGSSIVLHFYHSIHIALNLAKCWLGLAKALNNGDFLMDEIVSISFARYGQNDETSRVKIVAACEPTAEMIREIKEILKARRLECSIKIKNNVATYLSELTKEKGWPRIVFQSPYKETCKVEKLAKQMERMKA